MPRILECFLAGAACLALPAAARAADATPEEALGLTRTLQRYVGPLASGDHPGLTISPSGDHYDVSIDYSGILATARTFGFDATVSPSPMHFTLTKQADGKWRVEQKLDLSLDYKVKDQSGSAKAEGVTSTTLFDPELQAAVSGSADIATITARSTSSEKKGGEADVTSVAHTAHMDVKGEAAGPGRINVSFSQSLKDRAQHFSILLPDGDQHILDLAVGESAGTGKFAAFRNKAFLDLWAWLVAHPSREELRKDPGTFKELLRGLGPLFDRMDGDGAVKDIAVQTDMGWKVSIANATGGLGLNGAGATGDFHPRFALSGLVLPTQVMPPWMAAIAPRDVAFDVDVSGYDLSRVVDAAIAAIDLDKDPIISPADSAGFIGRLLPAGVATADIKTIAITGVNYSLSVSGQIKGGMAAMPTGALTISLKGFDVLRAALTAGSKTDRNAAQALAALGVARTMAKDGPDGTLLWAIATTDDGGVTVNGAPMGGGRRPGQPGSAK